MKSIFAQNIARLIEQQGTSMRAVSLAAGLNETVIRQIMHGRSKSPRHQTLQAIADALGTTVAALAKPPSGRAVVRAAEIGDDLAGCDVHGLGPVAHSPQERELLAVWRSITPKQRALGISLLRTLQPAKADDISGQDNNLPIAKSG